jgi:nucleoside-diphosphate-sugar epimerase
MTIETVVITGGNGRIGEAIIRECNDHGYTTVNLARGKQRETVSDRYVRTDLVDPGSVFGALTEAQPDAVVHMGTIPAPGGNPGYEVYESNVMSSYHVLEGAHAHGIETVCLASSINAMGAAFQPEPMEVESLPIDESHPVTPRDPYAMGKHALEVTCDGWGRKQGPPTTISTLRYPFVATDEQVVDMFVEADRSPETVDGPPSDRDELFSYVHLADAATIARLAVEADFEGHERFWAVAADTSVTTPSAALAERYYPDASLERDFDGTESLISIKKAHDVLGWEPEHSWRER